MNLSLNKIVYYSLLILFFSQFILTSIPAKAALLLLFFNKPVLPTRVYLYLMVVCFYWIVVFSFGYSSIKIQYVLFYFSFIPPLLCLLTFKPTAIRLFITNKFFIIILVITIIEALLDNSPFKNFLYFMPSADSSDRTNFFGFYQRPMGVAGNPSMTSCVMIFSAVLADTLDKIPQNIFDGTTALDESKSNHQSTIFNSRTLSLTATILVLFSGTGFGLLLLYFITKLLDQIKLNTKSIMRFIVVSVILIFMGYVSLSMSKDPDVLYKNNNKFSLAYAKLMFDYKVYSVIESLEQQNINVNTMLCGTQIDKNVLDASTSGDFGFLVTYTAIGAIGSILIFIAPLLFLSALWKFLVPTIFFYVSFLHYPGLLSPPGAVVFALYIYSMSRYALLINVHSFVSTTTTYAK